MIRNISHFISAHRGFMGWYLLFLAAGAVLLFATTKGEILLWINERHTAFGDVFFKYFTWFGDGKFVIGVVILLLFLKFRNGIRAAIAAIVCGVAIYFLKRGFDIDRPILFFKDIELHLVEGVKMNSHFSFPSGHTAGAFCLFSMLAFLYPNRAFQTFCFFMALVAGISRIYLVQHFFVDVYFGAMLGVFISSVVVLLLGNAQKN